MGLADRARGYLLGGKVLEHVSSPFDAAETNEQTTNTCHPTAMATVSDLFDVGYGWQGWIPKKLSVFCCNAPIHVVCDQESATVVDAVPDA